MNAQKVSTWNICRQLRETKVENKTQSWEKKSKCSHIHCNRGLLLSRNIPFLLWTVSHSTRIHLRHEDLQASLTLPIKCIVMFVMFLPLHVTYPIQSGCTTRSISSARQRSGPAESADTSPPPATRSNWPGCWTGRKPRLTCTLSREDTTMVWTTGGAAGSSASLSKTRTILKKLASTIRAHTGHNNVRLVALNACGQQTLN